MPARWAPNPSTVVEVLLGAHLRSFPVRLPSRVQERHRAQIQATVGDIAKWSTGTPGTLRFLRKLMGDPHEPNGSRVIGLRKGPCRRVWKPGLDRFKVELGCQQIISILGPESGLHSIPGQEVGNGGIWYWVRSHKKAGDAVLNRLAVGYAHLVALIVCFGLPDMHHENLVWDGQALRLIDTEFFAGPRPEVRFARPMDLEEQVAHRINASCFTMAVDRIGEPSDKFYRRIAAHLPGAFERFRAKWDQILPVRQSLTGLHSRIIYRATREFWRLLPFALSPSMRPKVLEEMRRNVPPNFDLEMALHSLANGCVPSHHAPIAPADHPLDGVFPPTPEVERLVLIAFSAHHDSFKDLPLETLLVESERGMGVAVPNVPAKSPGFLWKSTSLSYGILGASYLAHAADRLKLDSPLGKPISRFVVDFAPRLIAESPPTHGIMHGLGGEFSYFWAMAQFGRSSLPQGLERAVLDRLEHVADDSGSGPRPGGNPLDLAMGAAGTLSGLAKLHTIDWLPGTARAKVRLLATQILDLLVETISDRADHHQRLLSPGFIHGLAGVAMAMHHARSAFGDTGHNPERVLHELERAYTKDDPRLRQSVFVCGNRWGMYAALALWGRAPASKALLSARHTPFPTEETPCCGVLGLHMMGLQRAEAKPAPKAFTCEFGLGYFNIEIFRALLDLTQFGPIHDPIWGRLLNAPSRSKPASAASEVA